LLPAYGHEVETTLIGEFFPQTKCMVAGGKAKAALADSKYV
jgi:hypothetical protein